MSEEFVRSLRAQSKFTLTNQDANDLAELFFKVLLETVVSSNKTVSFNHTLSFKKTLVKERKFKMPDNSSVLKPAHYEMSMNLLPSGKKEFDALTPPQSKPKSAPKKQPFITPIRKDTKRVHVINNPYYSSSDELDKATSKPTQKKKTLTTRKKVSTSSSSDDSIQSREKSSKRGALKYPGSKPALKKKPSIASTTSFNDYANEPKSKIKTQSGISAYFGDKGTNAPKRKKKVAYNGD